MLLHVRLLGRFAVEPDGGRPVASWQRPSARRLMELLFLQPAHRMRREQIIEALFRDLDPNPAARALSKAYSMARASLTAAGLESDVLIGDREAIWLADEVEARVDLFELRDALDHALGLSAGAGRIAALKAALTNDDELLPNDIYEDWVLGANQQLEQLRAEARLALARGLSASAQPANRDLIAAWENVLSQDPTSEEACVALLRAHTASGRRDLATSTYQRWTSAATEMGCGPGEELRAAYARLRRVSPIHPSASSQVPPPPIRQFGRAKELDHVLKRLQSTLHGAGVFILIAGPAGIGKSHLCAGIHHALGSNGWVVASGAAAPGDSSVPYAALRSALQPQLVGSVHLPTTVKRMLTPRSDVGAQDGGSEEQYRLASELAQVLAGLADSAPLAVLLDDVQWMDPALQAIVARLAATSGARRWSFVLAGRSDEPNASLPLLPSSVEQVILDPLDQRAATELCAYVLSDIGRSPRGIAPRLAKRSGGNPFFAVELARQAAWSAEPDDHEAGSDREVPERVVRLLQGRLDSCSPGGERLVTLVALAGEEASHELVLSVGTEEKVVGSPQRCLDAISELVGVHLLRDTAEGLRLVHPLLRDAVLGRVNGLERAVLHTRIAAKLESLDEDDRGSIGLAAAHHRLAAFQAGKLRDLAPLAARAGFSAGNAARTMLADDAALQLLRGGLDALQRAPSDVREQLRSDAVEAWISIGDIRRDRLDDGDGAAAAFENALALTIEDVERGRAWSGLGAIAYRAGKMEDAGSIYRRGIASLQKDSPAVRARLESDIAWTSVRRGRPHEAIALLKSSSKVLEEAGDALEYARVLDRLAVTLIGIGRNEEALEVVDRAFAACAEGDDVHVKPPLLIHRALAMQRLGRIDEGLVDAREAALLSERAGDRYIRSVAHWMIADLLTERGDLDDALAERDAEAVILNQLDNDRNLAGCHAHRAQLLRSLNRDRRAGEAAALARAAAERCDDSVLIANVEELLKS